MPGHPPAPPSRPLPPARRAPTPPPRPSFDTAKYTCPTCLWVSVVDADLSGRVIRCGHCQCAGIVGKRPPADDDTAVMPAVEVFAPRG